MSKEFLDASDTESEEDVETAKEIQRAWQDCGRESDHVKKVWSCQ